MAKAENCFNCVYSSWDRCFAARAFCAGVPIRPSCANHPESFGRMQPCPVGQICRNFRVRPPTPGGETVKKIPLTDGYYTYVDAADYEWLSQWKWYFRGGYAIRWTKAGMVHMHREIMQPGDGMVVDHKNRNRLDNTRDNLRTCTHQENMQNARKRPGTSSRFKGVSFGRSDNKWRAAIQWRLEPFHLGRFTDEVEAARAYDRKAVELYGEFARLNLPEEWPPQRRAEVHANGKGRPKRKKRAKGRKTGQKTRPTPPRKT